ncbi:glycosyltransferase family 4 protein [Streptomyces sp. NPDC059070]|uniref:glycosyltransferase family 4 protein n=1 Tax=unclassified Streptomyces TaxID=2593676 RepID=UPI0034E215B1
MKVLLISDVDEESGRGPVTRLARVLPELTRRAEVVLVALGPPDALCRGAIDRSGVRVHPQEFSMRGWRVRELPALVRAIEGSVREEQPDLVVLYREIWDLMHGLAPVLRRLGVPFLVMPHSVPFLDAMPRPTRSFAWDVGRRLLSERRGHALRYLVGHVHQARLMRTLPRVVINETVDFYLHRYFPTAPTVRAIPGYAVDLPYITSARSATKEYDVAFMAKLTKGKGLFDALKVLRRLRATRPQARMVVIGSFEGPRAERAFWAAVDRYGLRDAIHLAGWLTGREKYEVLSSAKVFCYPSRSADTFSLCLLEALACGLPAVCYDVPFARAVYGGSQAVRRVPYGATRAMAAALEGLLASSEEQYSAAAEAFASRYCSWSSVADAEIAAYRDFLDRAAAGRGPTTHQNMRADHA